ncbi:glycosyl transferase group 1 [Flammeovirgaceae bacterium 311]|nr:glycosyl transferase group 1 [Flammeovirgaceae bacterium 311]
MSKNIAFYLADQNPHRDRSLGITNITKTLMGSLVNVPDYSISQIVSKSSFNFDNEKVVQHMLPWRTDNGKVNRIVTDNLHPMFLRSIRPDIWFYPKGYISYVGKPKGAVVSIIHDTLIQHLADKYPQYRSKLDFTYWLGLMKASIRKSDYVLTVSLNAKQQITDFCERYGIPVPEIHVTYEASDFEDLEAGDPNHKGNYIVHLASQHPYKKTLHLLNFWKQLLKIRKDLPELHLVGNFTPEVKVLANSMERVTMKPQLDSKRFVEEIRNAKALIFPSEFEGFGLPSIEAYFLNTPVCYVEGTSVAEILSYDNCAGKFSLDDLDSFAGALEDVLNLSPEEINKTRLKLRERYSKKNYLAAIHSVLSGIG